jgi:hypothetical protein
VRVLRFGLRGTFTQLTARAALALLVVAIVAPLCAGAQAAQAPNPHATVVVPKVPLHTEIFVDVNKYGQVSRMVSFKPSKDVPFNTQTYGNAEQAFIRKPDGTALPGLYRLSYDYDPVTKRVKRGVMLVKAGGVDPNERGLVTTMETDMKEHAMRQQPPSSPLPDFYKLVGPTASPHH